MITNSLQQRDDTRHWHPKACLVSSCFSLMTHASCNLLLSHSSAFHKPSTHHVGRASFFVSTALSLDCLLLLLSRPILPLLL